MLDPKIVTKFSGPPGTGKSTTLLNAVDQFLSEGIQPEDIVFTTFTRAGANEARDRACKRFNLPPDRFPYFRTIHSICHSLVPKQDVMKWSDWYAISKLLGISFSAIQYSEEAIPRGAHKGDYLMALWSLSRVSLLTPKEAFDQPERWQLDHPSIEFREFEHFIETIQNYKTENFKVDFTDMLTNYLAIGPNIQPHAAIVDEMQDLSKLQWKVVQKLCIAAKHILVAGDDDQCIHEWNGACPQSFISLQSDRYSVLPKSYRIPAKVHKLAERIISQVHIRLPKTYHPRTDEGTVEYIEGLWQVDLSKGTWLLLARNLNMLVNYTEYCRSKGYVWTSQSCPCMDTQTLVAIGLWKKLGTEELTASETKLLYKFLSTGDRIVRGNKKKIDATGDKEMFSYQRLVSEFGLLPAISMPWYDALDAIAPENRNFLQFVEQNEGLSSKPRIEIGSIHSAKGKEADHVVIMPDMAWKTYQNFETNPDAEHRVWYVGITRARHSLHILHPMTDKAYPL